MNLLAHAYLSGNSPEILIGNFIADFIKGNKYKHYPDEIIEGIMLHRKIDEYTDSHEVVKESIEHLKPRYGRYASVIVDIFYDHFLAINFHEYSELTLQDFSERTYTILKTEKNILPNRVQEFLPYMVSQNWLYKYSEIDGIERTLSGLSRRSKFAKDLETSVIALEKHYEEFDEEFNRFFPDLIDYVKVNMPLV